MGLTEATLQPSPLLAWTGRSCFADILLILDAMGLGVWNSRRALGDRPADRSQGRQSRKVPAIKGGLTGWARSIETVSRDQAELPKGGQP